jgi:hypothetical protein
VGAQDRRLGPRHRRPDTLELTTKIRTYGEQLKTVAQFKVHAGERVPFALGYRESHTLAPAAIDAERALSEVEREWLEWARREPRQPRTAAP